MMIWKSSRWGLGVVALRCIYLGPVSLAYLWSEWGTAKKDCAFGCEVLSFVCTCLVVSCMHLICPFFFFLSFFSPDCFPVGRLGGLYDIPRLNADRAVTLNIWYISHGHFHSLLMTMEEGVQALVVVFQGMREQQRETRKMQKRSVWA